MTEQLLPEKPSAQLQFPLSRQVPPLRQIGQAVVVVAARGTVSVNVWVEAVDVVVVVVVVAAGGTVEACVEVVDVIVIVVVVVDVVVVMGIVQFCPSHSSVQLQAYVVGEATHVPLFSQGSSKHSSTTKQSTKQ